MELGGGTGGGTAVVGPDYTPILNKISENLSKSAPYSKKRFMQECIIRLFANTNFKNDTNIIQASSNAINRVKQLVSMMELDDELRFDE